MPISYCAQSIIARTYARIYPISLSHRTPNGTRKTVCHNATAHSAEQRRETVHVMRYCRNASAHLAVWSSGSNAWVPGGSPQAFTASERKQSINSFSGATAYTLKYWHRNASVKGIQYFPLTLLRGRRRSSNGTEECACRYKTAA